MTQDPSWRVLLIDDDEEDYLLTRAMLHEARHNKVDIRWARNIQEALQAINQDEPDVVLVDYHLGQENGLEVVRQAAEQGYHMPFILLTGQGSYEVDLQAMEIGATDYLSKNEATPTLLERTIRYAIERQRLLEQNLQQKRLLEAVFTIDPAGLAVFSGPELRLAFANQAYRALLPDPEMDPIGKKADEIFSEDQGFTEPVDLDQVLTSGKSMDVAHYQAVYRNGQMRHFMMHLRPLFWQEEPAVLLTIWETTALEEARRQIQQAVEEATKRTEEIKNVLGQLETEQSRLNTLISNAPSAIVLVDEQARVLLSNPIADQIFAGSAKIGQPYQRYSTLVICHPNGVNYDPQELPLTRAALNGENFTNVETIVVWPDGQRRSILANAAPIRDHSGNLGGAVAVFTDITEHKQAEEDLRRNLAQVEVQRRLMQSREKERLHIAQDLHDGPLQGLIAMTFEIKDLINQAGQSELAAGLTNLQTMLAEQIHEIRAFSTQLRPPMLTPFGLEKAIHSHAETFQGNHPEIQFHLELQPDGLALPEEVRIVLFRIYQELLNNIVRHAEASEVWVRLSLDTQQVLLELIDDGCGFDVPSNWVEIARQGHLGLVGVQERAASVDGHVEIQSQPGKGATIRVTVPLIG